MRNKGKGQKVRQEQPIKYKHRYHTKIFGAYQLYHAELQTSTPSLLLLRNALQGALKLLGKVLAQDYLLPSPHLISLDIIPIGTTISRIQEPFDPTDVIADVTVEQGEDGPSSGASFSRLVLL